MSALNDRRPITEIEVTRPRNPEGKTGFFHFRKGLIIGARVGTGAAFHFENLWAFCRAERKKGAQGRRVVFIRRD